MKDRVAQIHIESINEIMFELSELLADDVTVSIKHIKRDLVSVTEEGQKFSEKIGKKPTKTKDALLWVHFGREKVQETLGYLQQLSDELDDIEDEINRDEVNNAK